MEVALRLCCGHRLIIHQQPLPLANAESLRAEISTFFQKKFQGADAE